MSQRKCEKDGFYSGLDLFCSMQARQHLFEDWVFLLGAGRAKEWKTQSSREKALKTRCANEVCKDGK